MNNDEVAMNNDKNKFRKMVTNSGKHNTTKDKINMQLISIPSIKTKDDLKIGHTSKNKFTENKIRKLPGSF